MLLLMCSPECLLEKQMPDRLGMSLSTFKTRKQDLFLKFKVHSRLELILKAVQWGLVVCYCGLHGIAPTADAGLPDEAPSLPDPELPVDPE